MPINPCHLSLNECDRSEIERKALGSLVKIAQAICEHPGTGQARRLVRFVAGCYNGSDYPFDLTDLRALDEELARACIDYLTYDRLGVKEIHHHFFGGARTLHEWMRVHGILPAAGENVST